ncbi:MAG: hypothetical protein SNJ82_06755, partial [Gemmataceae bacterium]
CYLFAGWLLAGTLQPFELFRAAAVSPEGKPLVVATVWALHWCEPQTGKILRSVERGGVRALAFSPDGRTLAAAERTIGLFDAASGKPTGKLFGHAAAVHSLAFLPGGQRLLSADEAGQVRLWDLKSQKALRAATAHPRSTSQLALASDGETVALATPEGVQLFEAATLLRRVTLRLPGSDQAVQAVAFSPDGRSLAALYVDHRMVIWELVTGQPRLHRPTTRELWRTLAFHSDGRTLLIGGESLAAWDLRSDCLQPIGKRKKIEPFILFPHHQGLVAVTNREIIHEPRLPDSPEWTAMNVAQAWEALDQRDAERAYRGLWSLLHTKQGIAHVVARLSDVSAELRDRRQKIRQLIADLDHEEFPVREKASASLAKLGPDVYDELESALQGQLPLEQHRRIERLLRGMKRPSHSLPAGLLRPLRGVEILEYAGTPEARAVLEKLANSDEPRLAASAKAALSRTKKVTNLGGEK